MHRHTLVTLHPVVQLQRYGFERTQYERYRVCQALGLAYLHVAYLPQLYPDWLKQLSDTLGIAENSLICLPNSYTPIGHIHPGLRPEELTEIGEDDKIETNEAGFVTCVHRSDGDYTTYYTTAPYLQHNHSTGELIWLDQEGRECLRGKYINPFTEPMPIRLIRAGYIYLLDGKILSEEELLIDYLSKQTDSSCIYFRDQHQYPFPRLMQFMNYTGRRHYDLIHQNVLLNWHAQNVQPDIRYLVANETLTYILQEAGYTAQFLPPIGASIQWEQEQVYGSITDYCFVGNMTTVKQPELVLETFIALYKMGSQARITFYGGLPEDVEKLRSYPLTPNIQILGEVDAVPYEKHQCYLSSSRSELFANACVEAMSAGLLALVSDVDFAHRQYAKESDAVLTFGNQEELLQRIRQMEEPQFSCSNRPNLELAARYSFEQLLNFYRNLLGISDARIGEKP